MTRRLLILLAGSCLLGCGGSGDESGGKDGTFFHDFEEVVANLQGGGERTRHVRATFTFEIDEADRDQAVRALEVNRRAIRDSMIVFLSAEPIQGITEKETLEHIRKEIRRITNQHLGEPFVKRVLLEKFAVQ